MPFATVNSRVVEPEILDSLAPDDPAALANRRDIRILNHLMGNFRWMARRLGPEAGRRGILELGGGDGSLGLYLRDRGCLHSGDRYCSLDLAPRPTAWPEHWEWQREDILGHDFSSPHEILLANLILHQFEDEDLRFIGQRIEHSSTRHILVSEPARRRLGLWTVPLFRLLGMHPVSLHDARVSIRAGFLAGEIHECLGLDPKSWDIRYSRGLGATRMEGVRR